MTQEPFLTCPECDAEDVVVTAEQMFYINTGEHYCHSVKTHDDNAKVKCLVCDWCGQRWQLVSNTM